MGTIYSVSQINMYIKNMFANDCLLRNVQIKGELSNVKYHRPSGHIYFTLKEAGSMISGVMFASAKRDGLDFTLEDGQSVIISGNVAVYERDGKYQIYARSIQKEGLGHLYEAYERLKQKLYEEGLFDFENKKDIPKYPKKVGIVTAGTSAAIQDIRKISRERNPYVQLYLYPAKVQGEGAAETIVKGIETLDGLGLDTIIIGRGGGSIEDLWAFNEEIVARAIYRAKTPIISGTGHQSDTTIADYAADLRAATPSDAIAQAIPETAAIMGRLEQYETGMKQVINRKLVMAEQRLSMLSARLDSHSPQARLNNQKIYLDSLQDKLHQGMEGKMTETRHQFVLLSSKLRGLRPSVRFERTKHRYELLLARLDALSPTAKLSGGFGYIEHEDGSVIQSVKDVKEKDTFRVTLHDGSFTGRVTEIREEKEAEHGGNTE